MSETEYLVDLPDEKTAQVIRRGNGDVSVRIAEFDESIPSEIFPARIERDATPREKDEILKLLAD
jgi:hypothetical protein